jgi:hypothetical protein
MDGATPALTSRRYVFLASSAYSGSTLLSVLLARHPSVATISDVSGTRRSDQMSTFRCSCGELMQACAYWARLRSRAGAWGIADLDLADFGLGFDQAHRGPLQRFQARSLRWTALERLRDRALAPLGVAAAMRDVAARSWALANAVMDIDAAEVFVDASKERLRIRYLEHHLPTPPLVVHLVRDVRGVADSTLRRGKEDLPVAEIARRWARTNDSIQRQLRELPVDRQLQIRYEDLCSDVPGVMRRVFAFVGVDADVDLEPIDLPRHMLGNQMRLSAVADIHLDERWRESIRGDRERAILRAAAPVFGRLYPDQAPPRGAAVAGPDH